jgi:hypothetical protein
MAENKMTPEESFRESLKDVIVVAQMLASHCQTIEELIGMAELALENDGQLRLLMTTVMKKDKR